MKKDSFGQVIWVIFTVCLTCSIIVSTAAVVLRSDQAKNAALERQINILLASGVLSPNEVSPARVEQLFSKVKVQLVDLQTGTIAKNIDPLQYDQRKAARDPETSRALTRKEDIAGIGRLERFAKVYFIEQQGKSILVLPIRGYGLWSTLYGYLALDGEDLNTIIGLSFAEHKETPGLGGEVDNPKWKRQWPGKKIYDDEGNIAISLVKNAIRSDQAEGSSGATHGANWDPSLYAVDALSGASLTSRGINNLLQFWFGEEGYEKFFANLKENKVQI